MPNCYIAVVHLRIIRPFTYYRSLEYKTKIANLDDSALSKVSIEDKYL